MCCDCDQGAQQTQSPGIGPPVNLVDSNIKGGFLPVGGHIELSFDRLLLPLSILRQTFVLNEQVGSGAMTMIPTVAYDPVARVVTITALPDQPFVVGTSYQLFIVSPSSPTDLNGLRAIDGANLSPSSQSQFNFQVVATDAGAPAQPPTVDFCQDIFPIFSDKCAATVCHGGTMPAEGLKLDTPLGVLTSAIDRVANGSNMGPLSGTPEAPTLIFNEDVPIIDPGLQGPIELPPEAEDAAVSGTAMEGEAGVEEDGGGSEPPDAGATEPADAAAGDASVDGDPSDAASSVDATVTSAAPGAASSGAGSAADSGPPVGDPAHSWLMYKLLMSVPPPAESPVSPSTTGVYSIDCDDAGDLCPTALSDAERGRLANLIPGREMPYPPDAAPPPNPVALTVDQLELVSFWIAQGAPVESACSP